MKYTTLYNTLSTLIDTNQEEACKLIIENRNIITFNAYNFLNFLCILDRLPHDVLIETTSDFCLDCNIAFFISAMQIDIDTVLKFKDTFLQIVAPHLNLSDLKLLFTNYNSVRSNFVFGIELDQVETGLKYLLKYLVLSKGVKGLFEYQTLIGSYHDLALIKTPFEEEFETVESM